MVKIADVERITALENPNALSLVRKFETAGILKEITGHRRNRVFTYRAYISLFD